MTNRDNLGEEDRLHGSGDALGNELTKMLKENEEAKERMRKDRLEFKGRSLYYLMKESYDSSNSIKSGRTENKKFEAE